jgi:hypothetical protein
MCTTSVIFKLLSKVNNHPLGENLPNLVTLLKNYSAPHPLPYLGWTIFPPKKV